MFGRHFSEKGSFVNCLKNNNQILKISFLGIPQKRWCFNTLQSLVWGKLTDFQSQVTSLCLLKWKHRWQVWNYWKLLETTWKLLISAKKNNYRLLRKNIHVSLNKTKKKGSFFFSVSQAFRKINSLVLKAKSLSVTDFHISRGKIISRTNWSYARKTTSQKSQYNSNRIMEHSVQKRGSRKPQPSKATFKTNVKNFNRNTSAGALQQLYTSVTICSLSVLGWFISFLYF